MSTGTGSNSRIGVSIAACAVMLLGAGAIGAFIRLNGVHMQKTPIYAQDDRQVSAVPSKTTDWEQIGADTIMNAEIVEVLGTENYVSRNYLRTTDNDPKHPILLELHLAYYTGMIDTVPHVPERCFVGGGLQQSESSREIDLKMDTSSWRADPSVPTELAGLSGEIYTVRLSNDPKLSDAPGQRVRLPRGVGPDSPIKLRASEFVAPNGSKIYAGYFFIANGGTKANANDVRQLAFNLDDDYAYFLKVQITGQTVDSFEEFGQYAGELVGELLGEIMRCVPDWTEVQMGQYPAGNKRIDQIGHSAVTQENG